MYAAKIRGSTMNQTVTFPFGKGSLSFSLPAENLAAVLGPNPVPPCADPHAEIERALEHPLGTPRLEEFLRPADRVVILVDDYTRATPVSLILQHLLKRFLHPCRPPFRPLRRRLLIHLRPQGSEYSSSFRCFPGYPG